MTTQTPSDKFKALSDKFKVSSDKFKALMNSKKFPANLQAKQCKIFQTRARAVSERDKRNERSGLPRGDAH